MSKDWTVDRFRNNLGIITKDLSDAIEKRPNMFVNNGVMLTYQLMDMQIKVSQLEHLTRIAGSLQKIANPMLAVSGTQPCHNCCKTAGEVLSVKSDNNTKEII